MAAKRSRKGPAKVGPAADLDAPTGRSSLAFTRAAMGDPDVAGALKRLAEIQSVASAASIVAFEKVHSAAPKHLFHYTTPTSLVAIVESGKLRAADITFMNDSGELAYGAGLISSIAAELAAEEKSTPARVFLNEMENHGSTSEVRPGRFYAACLSEKKDLLSQWRAYANDGLGYAIGLRTKVAIGSPSVRARLLKVIYEPKKQRNLVRPILQELATAIRQLEREGVSPWDAVDAALVRATFSVRRYLSIFKSKAFAEEAEWRIIAEPISFVEKKPVESPLRVTPSRFGLTPFVEVEFEGGLPIAAVVHGPRVPRVAYPTETLLKGHGHCAGLAGQLVPERAVAIEFSAASYR